MSHIIEILRLENAAALHTRAEDAARDPLHREQYDLCLARGVAPLRVLAEYTLPFCAVGGVVVALKKGDIAAELDEGRRAIGQLGGVLEPLVRVPALADLGDDRVLARLRKVRPTRADLPRAAGTAAKKPL